MIVIVLYILQYKRNEVKFLKMIKLENLFTRHCLRF